MSDFATRSFWLGRRPYQPLAHLKASTRADVVILGGGFTALWTAIHLKEAAPSLDIVILEREVVGYGGSGRNGGFALTLVARSLHDLLRKVGRERARSTHLEMARSLSEMEEFCRKESIEADLVRPGLLTVSNGPEQDVRIRQDMEAAQALGLSDLRYLDGPACRELLHTERIRCGHFEEHALLVDPAALSRGLAKVAGRRGVRIFEGTPVESFGADGPGVVARTPFGEVRAKKGLLATNAYAHAVPALRPFIFTLYAYIVVTEPLTKEQWGRVGWDRRMGVEDRRVMPHFHRPTADGRILWGGRDAPFAPEGPHPRLDRDERLFARLEETFRWTFPQLSDVKIAQGWAGPVCGTLRCFATVGRLKQEGFHYALGYAGHGVGPSHLVAKIARDVLLERQGDLLDLPMASIRPQRLPPEPVRSLMLNTALGVLQKADDTGGDLRNPMLKVALKFLE